MAMNNNVLIRAYREDDPIPPITELLHAAYAPLARMGFRYLATHQDDATTLRRLQDGLSFLAERDGTIVGTITLRPPQSQSSCHWYRQASVYSFGQFAVRSDLHRCGIGRTLLDHVIAIAPTRGATELALDTAEGATHLRQWYERLGFRFVEHVSWDETNYRSVVLSRSLEVPNGRRVSE